MAKKIFWISPVMMATMMIACSDSVAPPQATTIEVYSFADQQGFAGMAADADPEIVVKNATGSPIANIPVRFTVSAGGGSIENASTISGPQGRATSGKWMLGNSVGLQKVVASVDGVGSIEFRADAVTVPNGTFELATIDGQALPFTNGHDPIALVGGAFVLDASGSYSLVFRSRAILGGPINESFTFGSFTPKAPRGLSFYIDDWPWVDGRIDGDVLSVSFWDDFELRHAYEFIKQKSVASSNDES